MLLALAAQPGLAAGGCSTAELGKISKLAVGHYTAARYRDAASAFQVGANWTRACRDKKREALFLNGAAGSQFAGYRYPEALAAYQETLRVSTEAGEPEITAVASLNLSSLYTFLWEPAAAEHALAEAVRLLPADSKYQPKLVAQRMFLAARQRKLPEAFVFGRQAAEMAEQHGDVALTAMVWDKLGRMSLDRGEMEPAEEYIGAAFRLRKLNKLPMLESSYRALARLRLAQGRAHEARVLVAAAGVSRASSPSLAAEWSGRFLEAQALESDGDEDGALGAYRAALRDARRWRSGLLPAQWMLTAADISDAQVASAYARLAARAAERTNSPAGRIAARDAVLALEHGRALSLDALVLNAAWRQKRLPPEFGDLLSQLREAELRRMRGDAGAAITAEHLSGRLAQMEAGAGGVASLVKYDRDEEDEEDSLLPMPLRQMKGNEAHFSFLLGEQESWAWAMTRDGFAQRRLPGQAALEQRIREFRDALKGTPEDWDKSGQELYALLFGWSGKTFTSREHWSLSLDGVLFQLPVAALREGTGASARFLPEGHTLAVTPSLYFRGAARPEARGRVVAVGDCVYNRADRRYAARRKSESLFEFLPRLLTTTARADDDVLALPRLAGSVKELREVARSYRRQGVQVEVLSGTNATAPLVRRALSRPADVLHFAVHVVAGAPVEAEVDVFEAPGETGAARRPNETFLALSLGEGGRPDLLPASVVARRLRTPGALVVLSGCASGQGNALPGAGLQGFTHAWLAAGARGVIGSLWPVTDDSGKLFAAMYERLATGQSPRDALREAQMDMIRAGGWRSRPSYWAAYTLMGKE